MLTSAFAKLFTHFYPIGNTPAVCLTQCLPPEKQAKILLLGCGDARNILFTAFSDDRHLDITCCDVEGSVLARNILLFSLILDSPNDIWNGVNWNIYYHMYLDRACYDRLQEQAKKLHGLSASMDTWRGSEYGTLISFCDGGTLARVHEVWGFYTLDKPDEEQSTGHFETAMKTAIQRRNERLDPNGQDDQLSFCMTGLRSANPVGVAALVETDTLHKNFWKHGTTDTDSKAASRAGNIMYANPMLVSPDAAATLHYGTDPCLGFHISTAYAPLADSSLPQRPGMLKKPGVVASMQAEFSAWSDSFRQRALGSLTLRMFAGDAIAFSHVLQCRHATGRADLAHWYRTRQEMEPLALDKDDYGPAGSAPHSFNVIDTSNLIDHVGALNLLVATGPLLENDVSSSLYTETLAKRAQSHRDLVDRLLCGHLPTISLLLGLVPVEYWTNTSAGCDSQQESILDKIKSGSGQSFARTTWKRPLTHLPSSPIQLIGFDEGALAKILFRVYLQMFESEDPSKLFSSLILGRTWMLSLPLHHRASFAALLRVVKSRVNVDWDMAMAILLHHIANNRRFLMGGHYMQELCIYMHVLGVYSIDLLKKLPNPFPNPYGLNRDLSSWASMPAVVSVTLKVPREKLRLFTDNDSLLVGTPPVHCLVQSSLGASYRKAWQQVFAAVQMGFGQLSQSGSSYSNSCQLHIATNRLGWQGDSPLFVSFLVPSCVLLLEPQTARVAFGIRSTISIALEYYTERLGLDLNVFETTLADAEHVYISKYLPNQTGTMAVTGFADSGDDSRPDDLSQRFTTAVKASVDAGTGRISSFTAHLDITADTLKSALKDGCPVQTVPGSSNMEFTVTVGGLPLRVTFPTPVVESSCRTRIARKSSYIELVVQTPTNPALLPLAYPTYIHDGNLPTSWNMPYLAKMHTLPALDVSKRNRLQWLFHHTSMMFSARERRLHANPSMPSTQIERTRLNFKESLLSLFMTFTGLKGQKHHIFGLNNETGGGVQILLFASSLRLDLANRTVVLDVAALPLTHALMPKIRLTLQRLTHHGICSIRVDDAEMRLWRRVLPAYVERCRTWSHRPGCEYLAAGAGIPLSVEDGQPVLCACGNGILPPGEFQIPELKYVAKYAVRAAISPLFPCSLVDEVYDGASMPVPSDLWTEASEGDGCLACNRDRARDGTKLRTCAKCRKARYCSRACQRAHLKAHKSQCAVDAAAAGSG
ncbi:hypothetical protein B0T22DRAFT_504251 [Podospora appendiculata]|uniref:MYND-type domain-containing protein n=1 Tax=Podospora appendiculata TaxID=314037 RepID=A0AAE0XHB2_9PEZI|nr:hypothetical protein B0T22DRAFT_504251 [Podospora appendiculata]